MPCCKCTTKSPSSRSVKSMSSAERAASACEDFCRRGRWILYRPKISASVTTTNFASSQINPRASEPRCRWDRHPACSEIRSRFGSGAGRTPDHCQFLPNFLKPLPLAVVVAKDVDGIILPQPAVKLLEKFAALRLGDLRFRRALGQRTKGVERSKIAEWGAPREPFPALRRFRSRSSPAFRRLVIIQFNRGETAPVQFRQKIRPGNEKRIVRWNLLFVFSA